MNRQAVPAVEVGLRSLVWPLTKKEFISCCFGKAVHATHGGSPRLSWLKSVFGSFELVSLLHFSGARKVVAWFDDKKNSHKVEVVDSSAAIELYERGATLYFHLVHNSILNQWHASICKELGVPISGQISIVAAKEGGGVRPHFDASDNITIQLCGEKRWQISTNNSLKYPTQNWVPSCFVHSDLRSSINECVEHINPASLESIDLKAGSVLYLPRGFWHGTEACNGTSISLNLLFPPFPWVEILLQQLRHRLIGSEMWRKNATGIFQDESELESPITELDIILNDLKQNVISIKAEDIIPRAGRGMRLREIHDGTVVSRCSLARWRMHERRTSGKIVVIITSSGGFESHRTLSEKFIDLLREIDAGHVSLKFNDLRNRHNKISVRQMQKFVRELWLAGFVNVY